MRGKIISINTSQQKGIPKSPVSSAEFLQDLGIQGDAHNGPGRRQVSLLPVESIEAMNKDAVSGTMPLKPGDFAENITIQGIDFRELQIGDRLRVGESVVLEISQIGKECVDPCSIYKRFGNCIMPVEGIFARVVKGGKAIVGDAVTEGVACRS